MRCNRPATRTSKNSSRLLAEMARNFTRSNGGLFSSFASSSTRRLKASHEVSRLMYRDGSETDWLICWMEARLKPLVDDLRLPSIVIVPSARDGANRLQSD